MVAGDLVLTAALVEQGGDPFSPHTTATRQGDGWRLDGTKSFVPAGMIARGTWSCRLAPTTASGSSSSTPPRRACRASGQEATSRQIEAELELSGVVVGPGDVLVTGPAGVDALRWLLEHAEAALCLCVAGACDAAVKLTAQYTTSREQFGKPIATFQAVGQRAADAYIDAEAVRLTAWQAAWRLAEGLPATSEVAVAKYWADEGGRARRPRRPAPPRWHGRRPRLPPAPLLPADQAPGADPRGRHHQPSPAGRRPGFRARLSPSPATSVTRSSLTLAPSRSRTKSAPSAWDGV